MEASDPAYNPPTDGLNSVEGRWCSAEYSGIRRTPTHGGGKLPIPAVTAGGCQRTTVAGGGHGPFGSRAYNSVGLTATTQPIDNWLEIRSRLPGLRYVILYLHGGLFIETVQCRFWDGPWCSSGSLAESSSFTPANFPQDDLLRTRSPRTTRSSRCETRLRPVQCLGAFRLRFQAVVGSRLLLE